MLSYHHVIIIFRSYSDLFAHISMFFAQYSSEDELFLPRSMIFSIIHSFSHDFYHRSCMFTIIPITSSSACSTHTPTCLALLICFPTMFSAVPDHVLSFLINSLPGIEEQEDFKEVTQVGLNIQNGNSNWT